MFNNADVYCRSSKIGLATRKSDFLSMIQRNIEEWKENQIIQKMDFTSLIQLIVQSSHRAVINNGWDENEMDGVAWFIGNYADIITKARSDYKNNYDILFKMAFNLYFENRDPNSDFVDVTPKKYQAMNYLDLFVQNFKQDCTLYKIGYNERAKLEFDDYYKIGFQLDTFQLNYYDIHLLVDYEDELKAIHLLGANVSKIADEIQMKDLFYGVPVKIISLNDECLPGSITLAVKK